MNVMAGHSRPKDGVASLAYVPAISLGRALPLQAGSPEQAPAMTERDQTTSTRRANLSTAKFSRHQHCLWNPESARLLRPRKSRLTGRNDAFGGLNRAGYSRLAGDSVSSQRHRVSQESISGSGLVPAAPVACGGVRFPQAQSAKRRRHVANRLRG